MHVAASGLIGVLPLPRFGLGTHGRTGGMCAGIRQQPTGSPNGTPASGGHRATSITGSVSRVIAYTDADVWTRARSTKVMALQCAASRHVPTDINGAMMERIALVKHHAFTEKMSKWH